MKTVFVVLPFGIDNYLEVACSIAHKAELLLNMYLQLIPDVTAPINLLLQNSMKPVDFLHYSLSYMRDADVVVFGYGWKHDKECSLLHAIACAYEMNILNMEQKAEEMQQDSTSPKPCPFCHSTKLSIYKRRHRGFVIHCDECDANGSLEGTKQRAIDAWNNLQSSSAEASQ